MSVKNNYRYFLLVNGSNPFDAANLTHKLYMYDELLKALKEAVNVLESRNPEWEQTHFKEVIAKAEKA